MNEQTAKTARKTPDNFVEKQLVQVCEKQIAIANAQQERQDEPRGQCSCGEIDTAKHTTYDFRAKPLTRKTLSQCAGCGKRWTITETIYNTIINTSCPVTNYF